MIYPVAEESSSTSIPTALPLPAAPPSLSVINLSDTFRLVTCWLLTSPIMLIVDPLSPMLIVSPFIVVVEPAAELSVITVVSPFMLTASPAVPTLTVDPSIVTTIVEEPIVIEEVLASANKEISLAEVAANSPVGEIVIPAPSTLAPEVPS